MPQSDKHFDFAFRGFNFPKQGGSNSIVEGSLTSLLPHNHKIMQKNKEPSVTPNVPKALYFCGFSDGIVFLFPRYSGYIANGSKAPVFPKKQVLTFEDADKTLCMPVR